VGGASAARAAGRGAAAPSLLRPASPLVLFFLKGTSAGVLMAGALRARAAACVQAVPGDTGRAVNSSEHPAWTPQVARSGEATCAGNL
jgi:hypothetical protein